MTSTFANKNHLKQISINFCLVKKLIILMVTSKAKKVKKFKLQESPRYFLNCKKYQEESNGLKKSTNSKKSNRLALGSFDDIPDQLSAISIGGRDSFEVLDILSSRKDETIQDNSVTFKDEIIKLEQMKKCYENFEAQVQIQEVQEIEESTPQKVHCQNQTEVEVVEDEDIEESIEEDTRHDNKNIDQKNQTLDLSNLNDSMNMDDPMKTSNFLQKDDNLPLFDLLNVCEKEREGLSKNLEEIEKDLSANQATQKLAQFKYNQTTTDLSELKKKATKFKNEIEMKKESLEIHKADQSIIVSSFNTLNLKLAELKSQECIKDSLIKEQEIKKKKKQLELKDFMKNIEDKENNIKSLQKNIKSIQTGKLELEKKQVKTQVIISEIKNKIIQGEEDKKHYDHQLTTMTANLQDKLNHMMSNQHGHSKLVSSWEIELFDKRKEVIDLKEERDQLLEQKQEMVVAYAEQEALYKESTKYSHDFSQNETGSEYKKMIDELTKENEALKQEKNRLTSENFAFFSPPMSDKSMNVPEKNEQVKALEQIKLLKNHNEKYKVMLAKEQQQKLKPAEKVQKDSNKKWVEEIFANAIPKFNGSVKYLHDKIVCDVCQVSPLMGPRYLSLTRKDYDCCESCFKKSNVNMPMPMLKVLAPIQGISNDRIEKIKNDYLVFLRDIGTGNIVPILSCEEQK